MDSIKITRPVVIKVRVTENYKKKIAAEVQRIVQRLEAELQQLEFQNKKLSTAAARHNAEYAEKAKQQIESQIYERVQRKQRLLEKIKAVGNLKPGTEVVHGRVESLVELKVGDDWNKVMNVEVLVEDGKVLEIRHSGGSDLQWR
ncbi:dsDNA-specific endonuclease/ATPase MutS2 [Desulfohalotomaculum tongense]|uniref:YlqD family protein n=1 Tax=Desulforadius tongensis TaxID=1216062 RepID=UPI00195A9910|nr:YlqD family protein [Desulforadius tongensis]MBM7854373.1 dsDNA-specific endonuclease/ATPase MutS2 [Desulforadius tongensis]